MIEYIPEIKKCRVCKHRDEDCSLHLLMENMPVLGSRLDNGKMLVQCTAFYPDKDKTAV